MAFWELPGPILRPGLGNALKLHSVSFLGPVCGLGVEISKMAFWELRGPFCDLGLEILQNHVLGASWAHSAAWAWKCFKIAFWELPGPILRPGLGNAPNDVLGASWAHSAAWAWKCSKMMFWELPGPILRPGLEDASKLLSGGFLDPFCGVGLEMLQSHVLGASWAHSAAWAWKCSKVMFWELPGPILRPAWVWKCSKMTSDLKRRCQLSMYIVIISPPDWWPRLECMAKETNVSDEVGG